MSANPIEILLIYNHLRISSRLWICSLCGFLPRQLANPVDPPGFSKSGYADPSVRFGYIELLPDRKVVVVPARLQFPQFMWLHGGSNWFAGVHFRTPTKYRTAAYSPERKRTPKHILDMWNLPFVMTGSGGRIPLAHQFFRRSGTHCVVEKRARVNCVNRRDEAAG